MIYNLYHFLIFLFSEYSNFKSTFFASNVVNVFQGTVHDTYNVFKIIEKYHADYINAVQMEFYFELCCYNDVCSYNDGTHQLSPNK